MQPPTFSASLLLNLPVELHHRILLATLQAAAPTDFLSLLKTSRYFRRLFLSEQELYLDIIVRAPSLLLARLWTAAEPFLYGRKGILKGRQRQDERTLNREIERFCSFRDIQHAIPQPLFVREKKDRLALSESCRVLRNHSLLRRLSQFLLHPSTVSNGIAQTKAKDPIPVLIRPLLLSFLLRLGMGQLSRAAYPKQQGDKIGSCFEQHIRKLSRDAFFTYQMMNFDPLLRYSSEFFLLLFDRFLTAAGCGDDLYIRDTLRDDFGFFFSREGGLAEIVAVVAGGEAGRKRVGMEYESLVRERMLAEKETMGYNRWLEKRFEERPGRAMVVR